MCQACNQAFKDRKGVPDGYDVIVDTEHLCKNTLAIMVPVGDGKTLPRTELRTYPCDVQRDHVGPHRFTITTPNRGAL